MRRATVVIVTIAALVGACTSSGDEATGDGTATTDPTPITVETGSGDVDPPDTSATPIDSVDTATTTDALRPGVVPRDGSVEDVLAALPAASNFATGVADWLEDVAGQEGVLRNERGITLFVPVDDGFTEADLADAFLDQDSAALTISEHLRVGVLDDLDGTVTMASGTIHDVGADGEIGGRRVISTEVASNGLIYLISGPLGPN